MTETHIPEGQLEDDPQPNWFRAYINDPTYVDPGTGRVKPRLLGGGSRKHCERLLKRFRADKEHGFRRRLMTAKIVPVESPGKDPEVKFE